MKKLSVYTATTVAGETRVTMIHGFEHLTLFFPTRRAAALFLQALRHRQR